MARTSYTVIPAKLCTILTLGLDGSSQPKQRDTKCTVPRLKGMLSIKREIPDT